MKRKDNLIIWGFFSIVYIGSYTLLKQQSGYLANNAYLFSALLSISLTFLLDRYMKKRQAPMDKRSKVTKSQGKATKVVSLNRGKNHSSKGKKRRKAN